MSEDGESALVRELRQLASAGDDAAVFDIRRGNVSIQVDYTSGSSSSLTLSASYDRVARRTVPLEGRDAYRDHAFGPLRAKRPLAIVLRPETQVDVDAKRSGLSSEWQAGEPVFDGRVYVSTVTEDSRVLDAVLVPELREGVLQLFDLGFRSITIDDKDRRVVAHVTEFASREPTIERGARAVAAFAAVLCSLPALELAGQTDDTAPYAGWTRIMNAIGIVGWSLNIGYAVLLVRAENALLPSTSDDNVVVPCVAVVSGIAAGIVLSKRYAGAVADRTRGTSRAHDLASEARWASFGAISVVVFTIVLVVGLACTAR